MLQTLVIVALLVVCTVIHELTTESEDSRRRGRFLVDYEEAQAIASEVRDKHDDGVPWGGVRVPSTAVYTHFVIFGRTGGGKTILQRLLWQDALPQIGIRPDQRAIVYDPKVDLLSVLHGMRLAAPILILCPYDLRSAAWDIAADCPDPATATEIATIMIPEEGGQNRYFPDAVRDLLGGLLTSFATTLPANWTLRDVLLAMTHPGYLRQILARCSHTQRLLRYFDSERSFADVLTTINTKLGPLSTIAACWSHAKHRISLQDWQEGNYILVLGNQEKLRSPLNTIYRILFKRISEVVLAAPDSEDRRTWLFLDELRETEKVDGLARLLTQGRSKGLCAVLGAQGIEGIRDAFGDKVGEELVTQCSQISVLGLNSPATAEWASKVLGRYEQTEYHSSFGREGETRTEQVVNREAVMPSELLNLPSANPRNGIQGYHICPDIGAWFAKLPGRWVSESLLPPDPDISNFIPRPKSHHYLEPWDAKDLTRLQLQPEDGTPQQKTETPVSSPTDSPLRVVTPIKS